MKLKNVILTFENCEQIILSGEHVGRFRVEDIFGEQYDKSSEDTPYISHYTGVKTVLIEILKDANIDRAPFNEDLSTPYGQKNKHTVFERVQKYNDICWIDLDLELEEGDIGENPNHCYYVHWKGNNDYKNKGQYNYISKAGNLYVFITDKPFIKHRFKKAVNMKWINDPKNYDKEEKAKRLAEIEKEIKGDN